MQLLYYHNEAAVRRREAKRQELLEKKRRVGAPVVVALLPLSAVREPLGYMQMGAGMGARACGSTDCMAHLHISGMLWRGSGWVQLDLVQVRSHVCRMCPARLHRVLLVAPDSPLGLHAAGYGSRHTNND